MFNVSALLHLVLSCVSIMEMLSPHKMAQNKAKQRGGPNSENGFSHNINKVLGLNKACSHSHIVPVLTDIRSLQTHSSTGTCATTIQTLGVF